MITTREEFDQHITNRMIQGMRDARISSYAHLAKEALGFASVQDVLDRAPDAQGSQEVREAAYIEVERMLRLIIQEVDQ